MEKEALVATGQGNDIFWLVKRISGGYDSCLQVSEGLSKELTYSLWLLREGLELQGRKLRLEMRKNFLTVKSCLTLNNLPHSFVGTPLLGAFKSKGWMAT